MEFSVEIGGIPVLLHTGSAELAGLLQKRYGDFVSPPSADQITKLDIELAPGDFDTGADKDLSVRCDSGRWIMERGDFRAEWDAECRRGRVRQGLNPYGVDAVLRILHSLLLARESGFLVHAASAVRNGRAFLFAGVSGAGKTTMARLAPADVRLLTDEISYVKRRGGEPEPATQEPQQESGDCGYEAFGTPFAGELGIPGERIRAPLAALYLLAQAPHNCAIRLGERDAVRGLMRNILFFAHDPGLVSAVFRSALDFVSRVPAYRLEFLPDHRVWELIA